MVPLEEEGEEGGGCPSLEWIFSIVFPLVCLLTFLGDAWGEGDKGSHCDGGDDQVRQSRGVSSVDDATWLVEGDSINEVVYRLKRCAAARLQ